jgi:hypothetical protein
LLLVEGAAPEDDCESCGDDMAMCGLSAETKQNFSKVRRDDCLAVRERERVARLDIEYYWW